MTLHKKLQTKEELLACEKKVRDLLNEARPEGSIDKHERTEDIYARVDPSNTTPYEPVIADLARLHWYVENYKTLTIMEFGVGYSTRVFASALKSLEEKYGDKTKKYIRRSTQYRLFAVDTSKKWIKKVKNELAAELKDYVDFTHTDVEMHEYRGVICTRYKKLPNICPDLIYIDGPDQYTVKGNIRGISTRSKDRMPMVSDILGIEFFLQPGCIIVLDGRGANAQFLRRMLRRNWEYDYDKVSDQHIFILSEEPIGYLNKRHLDFINETE